MRNYNGNRLIDVCMANDLVITNLKFMHKDIHKITRAFHSRHEMEMFKKIRDVKVKKTVEINSDHFLVVTELFAREKINKEEKERKKKEKIKRYNLKDVEAKKVYQEKLK